MALGEGILWGPFATRTHTPPTPAHPQVTERSPRLLVGGLSRNMIQSSWRKLSFPTERPGN